MDQDTPAPISTKRPSRRYSWFVVLVLSMAGIVSFIDRQIINLLVEPIKADLGVTDVQISLLQGISFALFYAILAIPLAWIADRHNRKMVILLGLICWSAATFASGLASVFAFLFLARMLIGIGEATLSPAGLSIISDYFPKEKLPGPVSVFTGSSFVGSGLALTLGGYVYSYFASSGEVSLPFGTFAPWQVTFMCVAMLSVPTFILLLLVKEPVRQNDGIAVAADEIRPTYEAVGFIAQNTRVLLPLFFGFSCFAAAQFGINAWAPTYFIRVHGWSPLEVGQSFGPVVMLAGLSGVVAGGFLCERMLAHGKTDATLRLPIYAIVLALPFTIGFALSNSATIALILLTIVLFLGTIPFGAGVASFPLITPNQMRAQVMAVYLLIANLFGYGAGPIFIAWLTDHLFGDPALINLSLAIAPPIVMVAGIVVLLCAIAPYRRMVTSMDENR